MTDYYTWASRQGKPDPVEKHSLDWPDISLSEREMTEDEELEFGLLKPDTLSWSDDGGKTWATQAIPEPAEALWTRLAERISKLPQDLRKDPVDLEPFI